MATSMIHPKGEGSGTYTYSSQPRAVPQGKKYRDQSATYGNIMYDKRIVRGNTYALHTLPASSQPDPLELQRQQESRRRAVARKRAREQFRPRSPEAVEGRKHMQVQTELYLEEITDRVEEADNQTQTDAFLDRPPTPLFVPAKTGMDVATQIEEGDLFDFDLEVRPILEVLVGKTVEQALLEVMEEEELANLRMQQRQFEENRNAEMVETQRLEEQERRRREEKDRRMWQQREALLKEKETAEKIAARAFAQSYLGDLVPSVFSTLHERGFFYDPVEREVETVFMPWLMDETEKALDKKILARTLLDSIIREVVMRKLGIPIPEPVVPSDSPTTEGQPTPQQETVQTPASVTETRADSETDKDSQPQEPASGADEGKKAGVDSKAGDDVEGKKGDTTVEGGTEGTDSVTVQPGTGTEEIKSGDVGQGKATEDSQEMGEEKKEEGKGEEGERIEGKGEEKEKEEGKGEEEGKEEKVEEEEGKERKGEEKEKEEGKGEEKEKEEGKGEEEGKEEKVEEEGKSEKGGEAESQETEGKGERNDEPTEEPTGVEKPATESDEQPS